MSVVFRARDEPATSREEKWRHVLGETVGSLDTHGVPDRFVAGGLGALRIGELSACGEGGGKRTPTHIRRSDPDVYKIDVLGSGYGVIEQGGRQAALRPGDFTFVDLARPANWWTWGSARVIAVVFPRSLLSLDRDELARLTGIRISGDLGAGALVSSIARELPRQLDACGGSDGARLGTAVVDLLTASLAAHLDREEELPRETRQHALLLRIHAFIEERLSDPELSPGSIAAAHYISVRYLHKLFETEETTVVDWIRRRRLERCRRDLLDPALADQPAGAIGVRWGFGSAAHFSRRFRAAYGMPPAEYRRARRALQAGG